MSIFSSIVIPPQARLVEIGLKIVAVALALTVVYMYGYHRGSDSQQSTIISLNQKITATQAASDDQHKTTVLSVASSASSAAKADVTTSMTIDGALAYYRSRIQAQTASPLSHAASQPVVANTVSTNLPPNRATLQISAHIPGIGDEPTIPAATPPDTTPVIASPFLSQNAVDAINTMVTAANN